MKRNNLERSLDKEEISVLYDIPKSWVWVKLAEIVEKVPLTGKKLKQSEYQERGILPVIDQGHPFIGGYTDKEELKVSYELPVIVFGDHTRVVKYVDFDFVAGADGVKVIQPQKAFYPKLFYYFLHMIQLPDKGYARHFQFLEKSLIPLPPLPEQHRIVTKIEELLTKLDAGVEAIKKVKAQLKRYRQAVLKYAFEGKLTEEWREKHKSEIEPADVLLERIKEERKKNIKGKYKELPPVDTSNLPKLLDRWAWTKLNDICEKITDGTHFTPHYIDDGIPFISVKDIFNRSINFNNCKYIPIEEHSELSKRCNPEYLDVLITKSGTIGRIAVVKTDKPFSLFVSVALLKPFKSFINSYFLSFSLENYINSISVQQTVKGGVIKNLHIEDLKEIVIPLPSLLEQHKIVEEIERRFSVADEVEKTVDQNFKQAERLRQSILKKAFEGKLVPQDPTDEPADKLLERIKAEKAKLSEEHKTKSKRRKSHEQKTSGMV